MAHPLRDRRSASRPASSTPIRKRPIFKGKTLQYVEQSIAHWVMQRRRAGAHGPCARRRHAALGQPRHRRRLRARARRPGLEGGSDVAPGSYGEEPLDPSWAGDRIRDDYEIALLRAFVAASKPVLGDLPRRAADQRRAWRHAVPGHRHAAARERSSTATGRSTTRTATRPRSSPDSGLAELYPGDHASPRSTRCTTRRSRTSAATSSSRRARSRIAWSRRSAGTGRLPVRRCSGTPSSTTAAIASFSTTRPLLDDFLAAAQRSLTADDAGVKIINPATGDTARRRRRTTAPSRSRAEVRAGARGAAGLGGAAACRSAWRRSRASATASSPSTRRLPGR